jgi:hypothetical protein
MRVNLRGLHSTPATLSDGTKVTYWYAWRNGPRLRGQPGTPEFIASFNQAAAFSNTKRQNDQQNGLARQQQKGGKAKRINWLQHQPCSPTRGLRDRARAPHSLRI